MTAPQAADSGRTAAPEEARQLSLVVLAGGRSSRMGRDKADLELGGRSFLGLQIEKGRQLGIRDILISGYRGEAVSASIVPDRFPGRGPLGGLEACFRQAAYARVLVLGVDVPLVPVGELECLIAQAEANVCPATILQHGGQQEPLIGVYDRSLADAMREELTERKGSVFAFLRRVGYAVYESSAPEEAFANVNRPEDYERAARAF